MKEQEKKIELPKELQLKVDEMKKKHGDGCLLVKQVQVSDDDTAICVLLHPNFHLSKYSVFSRALTLLRQDRKLEAGTLVIGECWVGGDERFKNKEELAHLAIAASITDELGFLPVASVTL